MYKPVVAHQGHGAALLPRAKDNWQCLEMFLVVTTEGGSGAMASSWVEVCNSSKCPEMHKRAPNKELSAQNVNHAQMRNTDINPLLCPPGRGLAQKNPQRKTENMNHRKVGSTLDFPDH